MFKLVGITEDVLDEEFDPTKLRDAKAIFLIYSAETFLYRSLNQACREEDHNRVMTLGPFAYALGEKIIHGKPHDPDLEPAIKKGEPFTVARGLQLPPDEL